MLQVESSRDDRAPLVRERVLDHLDHALRHPVVLLCGLNGIGWRTALAQWAGTHGAVTVQPGPWNEQAAVRVASAVASGQRTVLVLEALDPALGEAIEHARSLGGLDAYLHVVVRGGVSISVHAADLRRHTGVEVVAVDPRLFLFSRSEIVDLGRLYGCDVDEREAGEILEATIGHPSLVSLCLRREGERVARRESWLEVAVRAVQEHLVAHGPTNVLPADLRTHLQRIRLLDGVPVPVVNALAARQGWARDLEDLLTCGLVTIGSDGTVQVVEVLQRALAGSAPSVVRCDSRTTIRAAQELWGMGEVDWALHVLERCADPTTLITVLLANGASLPDLGVARIRDLDRKWSITAEPELALLVARALVDLTMPGHDARVTPGRLDHATRLLATLPETLPARLRVMRALVAGPVARGRGDAQASAAVLGEAVAEAETAEGDLEPALHASLLVQHAVTQLSLGRYRDAASALARAEAHDERGVPAAIARAGAPMVLGTIETPRWAEPFGTEQPAAARRLGAYGRAFRAFSRLQMDEGARVLRTEFGPAGAEPARDPLVLEILAQQLESVAALATGTEESALWNLDVLERAINGRTLTAFETSLLRASRAELLSELDGIAQAEELLRDGLGHFTAADRVYARVQWRAGRPEVALDLIEPVIADAHVLQARQAVWAYVLHSLAARDCDREQDADESLRRALGLASRNGNLMPFARHGWAPLVGLVKHAQRIHLDPASEMVVGELERAVAAQARRHLMVRLSTREQAVLAATAQAADAQALADLLFVSPNTIKTQMRQVYRVLGVHGFSEVRVVSRALERDASAS